MIYFPDRSASDNEAFAAFLGEIDDHLVYVLREKFQWSEIDAPEMSFGGGHVVIRFEKEGRRMVFRVPQHGLAQLKRTMLAYRHLGHLGLMPEKIYHDHKCVIEAYLPGHPLNATVSDEAIADLAVKLAAMHAVPADGFGPLEFDLQGMHSDASAAYALRPPIAVDLSSEDLTAPEHDFLDAATRTANTLHADLARAPTFLGHGDLWRKNVLVDGNAVQIIDWDKIGAYPVEHDLVCLVDANFSEAQKALFLQHYARPINAGLLHWFCLRRLLAYRHMQPRTKIAKIQQHGLA